MAPTPEQLREAAEKGDASAQFAMGLLYAKGHGVPRSDKAAATWWRSASEQGHAQAQYNLGFMYSQGQGVSQSDAMALRWYRKAAAKGHALAQFNLGIMFEQGDGVAQSQVEAAHWYRASAVQGDSNAQCNIGLMYYEGRGVVRSEKDALKWWLLAAAQGDEQSIENLNLVQGGKADHPPPPPPINASRNLHHSTTNQSSSSSSSSGLKSPTSVTSSNILKSFSSSSSSSSSSPKELHKKWQQEVEAEAKRVAEAEEAVLNKKQGLKLDNTPMKSVIKSNDELRKDVNRSAEKVIANVRAVVESNLAHGGVPKKSNDEQKNKIQESEKPTSPTEYNKNTIKSNGSSKKSSAVSMLFLPKEKTPPVSPNKACSPSSSSLSSSLFDKMSKIGTTPSIEVDAPAPCSLSSSPSILNHLKLDVVDENSQTKSPPALSTTPLENTVGQNVNTKKKHSLSNLLVSNDSADPTITTLSPKGPTSPRTPGSPRDAKGRRPSLAMRLKSLKVSLKQGGAKLALEQLDIRAREAAMLATDSFAGRLENGLFVMTTKRTPRHLFFFQWQTAAWWETIIIIANFVHCSLSFWLLDSPYVSAVVELSCLLVKTVGICLLDFLLPYPSMIPRGFFSRPLRPGVMICRIRETRYFFSLVLTLIPKVMRLGIPIMFCCVGYALVGFEYFGAVEDSSEEIEDGDISERAPHGIFVSPAVAVYELVILTLTGDNFGDLMPLASLKHPSYTLFFFSFIVVAGVVFMDLALGLIFEAFTEGAEDQSSGASAKEIKGLISTFEILTAQGSTPTISEAMWSRFLDEFAKLNPSFVSGNNMDRPKAAALYYLIASEFTGELGIIGFLKLKDVLSYRFSYDLTISMEDVVDLAVKKKKEQEENHALVNHWLKIPSRILEIGVVAKTLKFLSSLPVIRHILALTPDELMSYFTGCDLLVHVMNAHSLPFTCLFSAVAHLPGLAFCLGLFSKSFTISSVFDLFYLVCDFRRNHKYNKLGEREMPDVEETVYLKAARYAVFAHIGCDLAAYWLKLVAPYILILAEASPALAPYFAMLVTGGLSVRNASRILRHLEHFSGLTRCLRLISVSSTLHGYTVALSEIFPIILQCMIFIVCVTYSYAEVGFLAFNNCHVSMLSSPSRSMFTIVNLLFDVDFKDTMEGSAEEVQSYWIKPLLTTYFMVFHVLGVMIFLNVINAIIIAFYSQAIENRNSAEELQEVLEDVRDNLSQKLTDTKTAMLWGKSITENIDLSTLVVTKTSFSESLTHRLVRADSASEARFRRVPLDLVLKCQKLTKKDLQMEYDNKYHGKVAWRELEHRFRMAVKDAPTPEELQAKIEKEKIKAEKKAKEKLEKEEAKKKNGGKEEKKDKKKDKEKKKVEDEEPKVSIGMKVSLKKGSLVLAANACTDTCCLVLSGGLVASKPNSSNNTSMVKNSIHDCHLEIINRIKGLTKSDSSPTPDLPNTSLTLIGSNGFMGVDVKTDDDEEDEDEDYDDEEAEEGDDEVDDAEDNVHGFTKKQRKKLLDRPPRRWLPGQLFGELIFMNRSENKEGDVRAECDSTVVFVSSEEFLTLDKSIVLGFIEHIAHIANT